MNIYDYHTTPINLIHWHHDDQSNVGVIKYYNKIGELHRENGPALICADGYKAWYINGELHRVG